MRAALLVILVACNSGGSGPPDGPDVVDPFDDCPDLAAACSPGSSCSMFDWEHGCSCGCEPDGRWTCNIDTIGSRCSTCPAIIDGATCTPGDRCAIVGPGVGECDCTCGSDSTWSCSGDITGGCPP
jgi:hypothetical protein